MPKARTTFAQVEHKMQEAKLRMERYLEAACLNDMTSSLYEECMIEVEHSASDYNIWKTVYDAMVRG